MFDFPEIEPYLPSTEEAREEEKILKKQETSDQKTKDIPLWFA